MLFALRSMQELPRNMICPPKGAGQPDVPARLKDDLNRCRKVNLVTR